MCLAIPMKVLNITNDTAETELGGLNYNVNISLVPETKINDYVIVHAGFAIKILNQKDAQERIKLFKKMEEIND